MTIEVLRYPLSKGEKTEKLNERVIEITESVDNRGIKPDVYLGIYKTVGKKKQVIVEDFFLNTDAARAIGQTMINVANEIDKKAVIADLSKMTKKPISKKESDLIGKVVKKVNKNNAKTIKKAGVAKKKSKGELVLPPQKIDGKLVKGLTKTSLSKITKKSDFKCKIAEKSNIECKIVAKRITKKSR